jgi:hypothetical protein
MSLADEGCYTSVGRSRGRNIVMLVSLFIVFLFIKVNLQEGNNFATCVEHEIVIHELFHTIGLWYVMFNIRNVMKSICFRHEQMRSVCISLRY